MENNNNKLERRSTAANAGDSTFFDLDKLERIAESIKNSKFAQQFKSKDNDGNEVVDTGDIMVTLLTAHELGLGISGGLLLGKTLNGDSYMAVKRGEALGLDAQTAMSKVYVITNKEGKKMTTLAVDIITKKIIEHADYFEYVRDYEYTSKYVNMVTNEYIGHKHDLYEEDKLKSGFTLYTKNVTTADEVKQAVEKGNVIIKQSGSTYVTSVRIKRDDISFDKTFHYSIQDAIDAELHRGHHSSLIDLNTKTALYVNGRDNWNKHPRIMLRNRVTSIAGRIAVADILQGDYSIDEGYEIRDMAADVMDTIPIENIETKQINNKDTD